MQGHPSPLHLLRLLLLLCVGHLVVASPALGVTSVGGSWGTSHPEVPVEGPDGVRGAPDGVLLVATGRSSLKGWGHPIIHLHLRG